MIQDDQYCIKEQLNGEKETMNANSFQCNERIKFDISSGTSFSSFGLLFGNLWSG